LANIVGLKSRASEILNRKETYIKWFVNFTRDWIFQQMF
jgi:hypothetical protein